MKSKVIETDKRTKFPWLGILENSKLIVLFNNVKTGVVISPGNSSHLLGSYSDTWLIDSFVKFEGKIELSND